MRIGVTNGLVPLPVQLPPITRCGSANCSGPNRIRPRWPPREIGYWRETLDGLPDQLELPFDRPRPNVASFDGRRLAFEISPALHGRLEALARSNGASLFMVMHSALAILLARLSGTSDVAVGSPIAGRGEQVLDDMIGMFVNTLVLRTQVNNASTFTELLNQAREVDLAAFAHATVPFERLVEALSPARSQGRHPLFQTMLSFEEPMTTTVDLDGVSISAREVVVDIARFDLQFTVTKHAAGGMTTTIAYATELFDEATAQLIAQRFTRVLEAIVEDPATVIGDIDLLTVGERAAVTGEWTSLREGVAPESTLADLFGQAAAAHPDNIAVRYGGDSLTYRELDERTNGLARALIASGVGPEDLVAVALPRSVDLVVALLATIKSGGGYLPIDPDYPVERLEFMLEDARPKCLVTSSVVEGLPDSDVGRLLIDSLDFCGEAKAPITDARPYSAAALDERRLCHLHVWFDRPPEGRADSAPERRATVREHGS